MRPDPELVSALRAAVERDPDSVPLRLHLADMLLAAGAPAEALQHYAAALGRDPSNVDALGGAQRAAEAMGGGARADGGPEAPPRARPDPLKPAWWDAE